MARIRKRLNAKRRRTGFVPSKPWTPKPTFAQLVQRMRENMRCDVKSLVPVHEAFARMRDGLENIRIGTVFPPHTTDWAKELRELAGLPVRQSRTIAISTPSGRDDAFERMYLGSDKSKWKTEEQTTPFTDKLMAELQAYKAQPTDHLILPSAMYDTLGKSTTQPVATFADGQAITLGVDVGRGYDETAGMLIRRHPNGDIEVLKRFKVTRGETTN